MSNYTGAPHIRFLDGKLHLYPLATRLPFKYGITTLTKLRHCIARATFEIDGKEYTGVAADNIPPKWFVKDPNQSFNSEDQEMMLSIDCAIDTAKDLGQLELSDWIAQLFDTQWANDKLPPHNLLRQFGATFWERTAIDAVCRARNVPFAELLSRGWLAPPARWLSQYGISEPFKWTRNPLSRVFLRHTVGMVDEIRMSDVNNDPEDGLPVSLEENIRRYGLSHFKIKLSGDNQADIERLVNVFEVIHQHCGENFRFTLDGNENFIAVDQIRELSELIESTSQLKSSFKNMICLEQPLRRDVALSVGAQGIDEAGFGNVPTIIDESDADLESFRSALELGYRGVSHKNCKGILKSLLYRYKIDGHNQRNPGRPLIMTGEDLTVVPPVSLLQDLNVQAHLGNDSVERNGHHYFGGDSGIPADDLYEIAEAFPELFSSEGPSLPSLSIVEGKLNLEDLIRQRSLGYT